MNTSDFYNIIDNELDVLLEKYKDDAFLEKHKKNSNNQKSYAFLIWFLGFYGKLLDHANYITEGSHDNSCDVVIHWTDDQGKKVFYVVQSKWNNARKAETEVSRDEILKGLSEFETLMAGKNEKINDKLKAKLEELSEHLKANGEVKFIFLSLAQYKGGADDNIRTFLENDPKRSFEVIDINRIRNDYINRNYKQINPINPLETQYNPEEDRVKIQLAGHANFIKVEKPFDAYTVLVRPKMIYELFNKYNFLLFFENIRNPLLQSQFNPEIEYTISKNPAFFWYYNNGITAITHDLPTIGQQAENIEVGGLQIINGAQTVYSIYHAYSNALPGKRRQIDQDALITLRLLRTGGRDFDINVTRYTNSQSPIRDSDFFANDDIQLALQNTSYDTPVWYRKRRGEFRVLPEGIRSVSNEIFADIYLAYHLDDPVTLYTKYLTEITKNKNLSFISANRNNGRQEGLYEKIFNEETTYEDMLSAFYVADTVLEKAEKTIDETSLLFFYWLALSKFAITKYLQAKFDENINASRHIIRSYEKGEKDFIIKAFGYTIEHHAEQLNVEISEQQIPQKFNNTLSFNEVKRTFEWRLDTEQIENMTIDKAKHIIKTLDFRPKTNKL